jgi:hypothetical protein
VFFFLHRRIITTTPIIIKIIARQMRLKIQNSKCQALLKITKKLINYPIHHLLTVITFFGLTMSVQHASAYGWSPSQHLIEQLDNVVIVK